MTVVIEMITYNHGPFISQAIESVMGQKTNFPYCLYIFEDCSTDNTAQICQELALKYPEKIKLHINEVNLGMVRNARLMHEITFSSGAKYMAMCEGDDYWTDPSKLQKQVDFLEQHPNYNLCVSNIYLKREPSKKLAIRNDIGGDRTYTISDLAESMFINTVSAMVRLNSVRLTTWFSEIEAGDYFLFLMAAKTGKIYYMSKPMAVYRLHSTSSWASKSWPVQLEKSIRQMEIIQRDHDEEVQSKLQQQIYALHFALLLADASVEDAFAERLSGYMNHGDAVLRNYIVERLRVIMVKESTVQPYKRDLWKAIKNRAASSFKK